MRTELETAKELLASEGLTLAVCRGDFIYKSTERGVKPLLDLLETGADCTGASAADRTVGRGAAMLYALLGVSRVTAYVMSKSAKEVLLANGIVAECEREVEYIINRKGDGMCPIEQAVTGINDLREALAVIKKALDALSRK